MKHGHTVDRAGWVCAWRWPHRGSKLLHGTDPSPVIGDMFAAVVAVLRSLLCLKEVSVPGVAEALETELRRWKAISRGMDGKGEDSGLRPVHFVVVGVAFGQIADEFVHVMRAQTAAM